MLSCGHHGNQHEAFKVRRPRGDFPNGGGGCCFSSCVGMKGLNVSPPLHVPYSLQHHFYSYSTRCAEQPPTSCLRHRCCRRHDSYESGNKGNFNICAKTQLCSFICVPDLSRSGESKGASSFHINKIRQEVTSLPAAGCGSGTRLIVSTACSQKPTTKQQA